MPQTVQHSPKLLTSFVQGELVMAQEYMEDAVVYLQLRNFISAVESLRRATLVMNLMERYLQGTGDDPRIFSYQVNVKMARERIRALSGTIPN